MTYAEFRETLRADLVANAGNTKGRLIVTAFRWAAFAHANRHRNVAARMAAWLVHGAYRVVIDYGMGVYLPVEARIGKGLCVWHGVGLVVHPGAVIGEFCTLRHGVTIGSRDDGDRAPVIGNHVAFGAHAVVIGDVLVGDYASVGAASVVLGDVPKGTLVVGNPGVVKVSRRVPTAGV